jgi:hypothetical protein
MKATDIFKRTIQAYLVERAASDELFAGRYANPAKTIDDCITYILNTVQKSGCNGFADDEIYGMAVHYYDEDNIHAGNPVNCRISINHVVELTGEEKKEARREAVKRLQDEEYNKLKQPKKKAAAKQNEVNQQLSFF